MSRAGPLEHLTAFGRELRAEGLPVGTGRIVTFVRATAALAPLDRDSLYWAGRTALVARPEHLPLYERIFDSYFAPSAVGDEVFERIARALDRTPRDAAPGAADEDEVVSTIAGPADEREEAEGETTVRLVASAHEVLKNKSFEELSELERSIATMLIRDIAVRMPARRSRRLHAARTGRSFDMRRTLRSSLRTEGEPFRRAWRARRKRPRPLVLILDISGSMSAYSRALMQFGFATLRAGQRVEVFCFGTRLTRITRSLQVGDPDRALEGTAAAVSDWEGGTRIGGSLKQLLDAWGQNAAVRGSVVVVCSDGLERGDPAVLAAQTARLARLAHRVVWVNPLKGSPRYEPLARGMAAALPHVDVFLPGHNVASLEALADVLDRCG
ncbi:MAG: VWA domain-containing protein [Actinomycetota bacterium]